ncbi:acetyl-CoA carboxylase biotin carboxylase subunit family protein [Paraliomyxa miuraensis]|uniref:hypothetical protein n=1 Tax=Paraliomyxa miuraensis TaxID=376150 RepID=UPI002253FF9B|nr:hypothetical protein [Paraliomyxa miuraensis]MCX4247266.1 hypothetical protein [Paraliomyxa miuraensis]
MSRLWLPTVLLLACTTNATTTEGTTPPSGSAAAATADGAAPAHALDAELVQTATAASKVEKVKLRVDAQGNLVKQALYHDDAASIPAPVIELAKSKWPKATITRYETELYADRGRVYEVEVDDGGTLCEVAASPEGAEVYTECRVDPASLSAELKAAIEQTAPGGKILEAETKKGPEVDEVTVEVEHGGRELYLRMRPDGSVIQTLQRIPAIVEIPL